MNVSTQPLAGTVTEPEDRGFERVFHEHYRRIARVLARIVHDPGRAEELAADVFCRFLRHAPPSGEGGAGGWLYRTAVRVGLDELRRLRRREKYAPLLAIFGARRSAPSPESLHAASQDQQQVRTVLSMLRQRDAELLILRSEGIRYQEIAEILDLNETSLGTLIRRAQDAFRKEYLKRYGQRNA